MLETLFSGFQLSHEAERDLELLIKEDKWRKLQKQFFISLHFFCCHCDLQFDDLETLSDHFCSVHQINESWKLDELLDEADDTARQLLSTENNLDDSVLLSECTNDLRGNQGQDSINRVQVQQKKKKRDEHLNVKQRRTRISRKRKKDVSPNCDLSKSEETCAEKGFATEKEEKPDVESRSLSVAGTMRTSKRIREARKLDDKESEAQDESTFHSEMGNDPFLNESTKGKEADVLPKRTTCGRDLASEEIKSRTCAICREMQPTIKDCFKHYEIVHNYVPKSVYDKPPKDKKYEENKAKSGKPTKGESGSIQTSHVRQKILPL